MNENRKNGPLSGQRAPSELNENTRPLTKNQEFYTLFRLTSTVTVVLQTTNKTIDGEMWEGGSTSPSQRHRLVTA